MEPYQQRLLKEHSELQAKLTKLTIFVQNGGLKLLPKEDAELLDRQHKIMGAYAHVLKQRVDRIPETTEEDETETET